MAEGCHERFDLRFVLWVWNYGKRSRPKIIKLMDENAEGKKIIFLRSNEEVERFMAHSKTA